MHDYTLHYTQIYHFILTLADDIPSYIIDDLIHVPDDD